MDETRTDMPIRPATPDDFSVLQAIELAAFATLHDAGAVSGEPSASRVEDLQLYLDHGLLRVVVDRNDVPVGYAGGYVAQGWLHIGEMDVHPAWQRRGFGRRLMTALLDDGRASRLKGATLTTDRHARFNAPFYASLGFRLLERHACAPRLATILQVEIDKGADPLRRVGMVLVF